VAKLEGGVQPSTRCRDWKGWLDQMPPGRPTLHVTGHCEFPTGGYTVRLERHEPQGFNPRDLLLDLLITEPTEAGSQAVTQLDVAYQEDTEVEFDSVTILPNGPTVEVTSVT
jgi:hypothetical protein